MIALTFNIWTIKTSVHLVLSSLGMNILSPPLFFLSLDCDIAMITVIFINVEAKS